ncbi:hypothetical protein [Chitinophaga ginsengisoli]|uniref:Uncharacterized protein n=1 Tax=Chitinophaga ginsengisoli TaxID=363837 RepID=A0A2P8G7E9_9BACT|nr:hypothetical protein [Chitinophaga ginsengisoli]PSL29894.1 hypothetical protein CLV42_106229 [Chitinophaga ginsengisoli]
MFFCENGRHWEVWLQELASMKQLSRTILFAVFFAVFITSGFLVKAQTTITPPVFPNFSALIKTGKIQLEMLSGFRDVKFIGVQRSLDSVLNFSTIGLVASPNDLRIGYQDVKPLPGSNYYRLFIQFNNGRYFYSNIILAIPDSTIDGSKKLQLADVKEAIAAAKEAGVNTNPTATTKEKNAPPKEEKIVWHPSNYVYTTADGNVNIKLPDAPEKKYSVKFFEPDGSFLFEIDEVKEPFLILEKAIFLHSGWFNFEIDLNGKPYEKWNLFIPLNYRN